MPLSTESATDNPCVVDHAPVSVGGDLNFMSFAHVTRILVLWRFGVCLFVFPAT